jgi:RIO kinase 1
VDAGGPVIIDLPQAVDAAGNSSAAMLESVTPTTSPRTSASSRRSWQRLLRQEIWSLCERGALTADVALTGHVEAHEGTADVSGVMREIRDVEAEHEARLRYLAALRQP